VIIENEGLWKALQELIHKLGEEHPPPQPPYTGPSPPGEVPANSPNNTRCATCLAGWAAGATRTWGASATNAAAKRQGGRARSGTPAGAIAAARRS
jgi:hypothetical protein